jgi:hypothetical protein
MTELKDEINLGIYIIVCTLIIIAYVIYYDNGVKCADKGGEYLNGRCLEIAREIEI